MRSNNSSESKSVKTDKRFVIVFASIFCCLGIIGNLYYFLSVDSLDYLKLGISDGLVILICILVPILIQRENKVVKNSE